MKKILFATLFVTFLAPSCSKEAKLNRRIDGIWYVTSYNGVELILGKGQLITFEKDKKGVGSYTWLYSDSSGIREDIGTYDLDKDELITLTSKGFVNPLRIIDYSKTDLTLTNGVGDIIKARKWGSE